LKNRLIQHRPHFGPCYWLDLRAMAFTIVDESHYRNPWRNQAMLPLRTRIFVALKFWLPRLRALGKIISLRKVDARTLAQYEIEKAKNLRIYLFKELAKR